MTSPSKFNILSFEKTTGKSKIFPVLKTQRLHLGQLKEEDAEEICAMRNNSHINQFMARPQNLDLAGAKSIIKSLNSSFENNENIVWGVNLRDEKQICGIFGFNKIDRENFRAEIGGEMSTEYWGKDIAAEAVNEIINYGLSHFALQTIEARVWSENRSAIHLLENLGFIKEAFFKNAEFHNGKFVDVEVYTLHRK